MMVPHRGVRTGGSVILCSELAPRKRAGLKFVYGSRECAAEVVVRSGVAAWKPRAAIAQDVCYLWRGRASAQQLLSDPFIGDTPVWLWEAFENPQPVQPSAIDTGGLIVRRRGCIKRLGGRDRRDAAWNRCRAKVMSPEQGNRVRLVLCAAGRRRRSQAGSGVQDFHPRRIAASIITMGFFVGKPGQATQMTPIGASQIATVSAGQQLTNRGGDNWIDRRETDLHPGLEIAGAGLQNHTGFVPVVPHGFQNCRAWMIQIDENVAGVALRGVGLDVHVAAFPVASAQKSHSGGISQLCRGPQPLSGKRSSGLAVDETDEVEVVRHGRELAAHGLHSEIESEIEHGPNFRIEGTGSTITFQRTVISGLTGCLSQSTALS